MRKKHLLGRIEALEGRVNTLVVVLRGVTDTGHGGTLPSKLDTYEYYRGVSLGSLGTAVDNQRRAIDDIKADLKRRDEVAVLSKKDRARYQELTSNSTIEHRVPSTQGWQTVTRAHSHEEALMILKECGC